MLMLVRSLMDSAEDDKLTYVVRLLRKLESAICDIRDGELSRFCLRLDVMLTAEGNR